MTTKMTTNSFCWVELTTDDVEKAKGFYGSIFGWTFEVMDIEGQAYTMIVTDEGPKGGIMARPRQEIPICWTNYISVDEHASYLEKVANSGGKVLTPETQVPGSGSFSIIQDPSGAVIGLWKNNDKEQPCSGS